MVAIENSCLCSFGLDNPWAILATLILVRAALKWKSNVIYGNPTSYMEISHDMINRYLDSHVIEERNLYDQLYLNYSSLPPGGYLIFDDTVLDKRYSRQIAMVGRQYSGNVKGIGLVVCLYYVSLEDKFYK